MTKLSKRILRFYLHMVFLGSIYLKGIAANMRELMELHEIVPDVIAVGPESTLQVIYEGDIHVENGNELTPTQVKDEPVVTWDAQPDAFYTLLFINPDYPSREEPKLRDSYGWGVVNIPGNNISNGDAIAEYSGIAPTEGTGIHRYVFLLFKQPGKMDFDEEKIPNNSAKGRFSFATQKFVEKYSLGVPVAGNFFTAQYDEYVPQVFKKLGMYFDYKN